MKSLLKDGLGWGFLLWLIGYILGFILFAVVSPAMIGWIIMPIGTVITLLVLFKKIKGDNLKYYLTISVIWTLMAIVCDYLFLVKLLNATNYYKFDVYFYYTLTFALPLIAGAMKKKGKK